MSAFDGCHVEMIGLLRGFVHRVDSDRLLLDVNGVGYLVHASTRTLGQLPHKGEAVSLFVETVVREDAILLFGFLTEDEQNWFRLLTTVQGVGAKVALAVLSVATADELVLSIRSGDKAALTRASGVGGRLAERILIALKNHVGKMPMAAMALPGTSSRGPTVSAIDEALQALSKLGFRRAEAWPIVNRLYAEYEQAPLDELIRNALKELAK